MQYNGDLKNRVISKFNNATKQINSCKSAKIKIPPGFEGAGTINSALTKIKAVNVDSIKGEFERVAAEAEATEAKAFQNAFGFGFAGYDVIQKLQHNNLQSKKYEILKNMIEVTDMKNALKNHVKNNYDDLDENVKKEMINSINIINLDNVIKSGIPVDEYEKRLMNAFDNVSVYCNTQRKQLNKQGVEITDKEIDIETENTREYLKNIRETTTYIKDGVIYVNLDGTPTKLTPEMFLEAVKNTQNYIYENSSSQGGYFRYGNSNTVEAGQLQDTDTGRKCFAWI